ncbi:GNAT family N-acetyltransferase [Microlunatus antarcticus]
MPGADGVRLERFPLATVRDLVDGNLDRPDHWHPEYDTASITGIARMLLAAHEAMGVPADEQSPWWVFAVVVDDVLVGDAGFHGPPAPLAGPTGVREVEIGYQVVPALRGRGVATRACALLLEHAWRNGAQLVRADVEPDNPDGAASRAVLRANGFRPTPRGDFAVEAPVGLRA